MINIKNDLSFQNIIVSAIRYALGRHTYIVLDTTSFVLQNYEILTKNTIDVIVRDVTKEIQNMSDGIDKDTWKDFLVKFTNLTN